jgi:hypothetical protein
MTATVEEGPADHEAPRSTTGDDSFGLEKMRGPARSPGRAQG